jgi:hypothetical protein
MDSPALDSRQLEAELTEGGAGTPGPPRESANLRAMRISHPDCRFRPASAGGRVLQGHDEIRAHFSEPREDEGTVSVHPRRFAEHADEVVVTGSMRVLRPEGGFAESQVSWTYRFRDGLVEEAAWGPPQTR